MMELRMRCEGVLIIHRKGTRYCAILEQEVGTE